MLEKGKGGEAKCLTDQKVFGTNYGAVCSFWGIVMGTKLAYEKATRPVIVRVTMTAIKPI